MAENNTISNGGIGFVGALTILFVALKLTGNIDWSWWQVLSPIWIAALSSIIILVVFLVFVLLFDRD